MKKEYRWMIFSESSIGDLWYIMLRLQGLMFKVKNQMYFIWNFIDHLVYSKIGNINLKFLSGLLKECCWYMKELSKLIWNCDLIII